MPRFTMMPVAQPSWRRTTGRPIPPHDGVQYCPSLDRKAGQDRRHGSGHSRHRSPGEPLVAQKSSGVRAQIPSAAFGVAPRRATLSASGWPPSDRQWCGVLLRTCRASRSNTLLGLLGSSRARPGARPEGRARAAAGLPIREAAQRLRRRLTQPVRRRNPGRVPRGRYSCRCSYAIRTSCSAIRPSNSAIIRSRAATRPTSCY